MTEYLCILLVFFSQISNSGISQWCSEYDFDGQLHDILRSDHDSKCDNGDDNQPVDGVEAGILGKVNTIRSNDGNRAVFRSENLTGLESNLDGQVLLSPRSR